MIPVKEEQRRRNKINVDNPRVLVLNAGFQPLGIASIRRVVGLVMSGLAEVVVESGEHLLTPNSQYPSSRNYPGEEDGSPIAYRHRRGLRPAKPARRTPEPLQREHLRLLRTQDFRADPRPRVAQEPRWAEHLGKPRLSLPTLQPPQVRQNSRGGGYEAAAEARPSQPGRVAGHPRGFPGVADVLWGLIADGG